MQLNKVEIFGNLFGHWFKKKKKKQLHISVWGWRLRWAQLLPRTARHVARARRSQSCTQHGTVKGRGGRRCWRRRLATELLTFSQMEVWVSCATEYGVAGIHGRLAFSGATSRVAGVVGPNLLLVGVVDWDHTLAWCVCVCVLRIEMCFFFILDLRTECLERISGDRGDICTKAYEMRKFFFFYVYMHIVFCTFN